MRQGNLRKIDLNLLTVLDELLRQQNATRAARALGLSQPAVSRALGRLRTIFGDPLFVRSGRSFVPTLLADKLRQPLGRILEDTRALINPRRFDPAQAQDVIRINAPDATTLVVLTKVCGFLCPTAPNLRLVITNFPTGRLEALASGEIDLAIDFFEYLPRGFFSRTLMSDRLACLVRRGHPALEQGFDLEAFAGWPHIRLDTASNRRVRRIMGEHGHQLHDALSVPNVVSAAAAAAATDWLLTLPRNLAQRMSRMFPLEVIDFPLDIPRHALDQVWHERLQKDPGHIWLRDQIQRIGEAELSPLTQ